MPRGQKSKLRAREKRRQNKSEPQSPESVQAAAGEEEEAACSSSSVFGEASSSSTGAVSLQVSPSAPDTTGATAGVSCKRSGKAKGRVHKSKNAPQASTSTEFWNPDLLTKKARMVMKYVLSQYHLKKPIKKAEMLKVVHKWYKKDFPEILRRVTEQLDLIYGLELKEDKPNGTVYNLTETPGTSSLNKCWRFPIKGILMLLLGVIFLNGKCASEAEIWKFLNFMGVYDGKKHFIYGEPRKLITEDLVQEEYLVYRQVPFSDPPDYEFLWGPRAEAETTTLKVLEFFAKLNDADVTDFPILYARALREEEERAQTIAQAASTSTAGPPPEASGSSSTASSCDPHPE
ncbi:melanoma-associated antigen B4-like [Saccopteryx bilineata]|uniref:melanoma-associated antigen B4-like n=1 Tax=Saccopteryx bilineata TaxID=59482 RepID=UPI00338F35CA